MALHLRIENETTLPDGGPISLTISGRRGIDIGRDGHLDWTLPDPTRFISSKHAEIRYREGSYWLHDVSTNGTFLNGGDHRMQAPHRLRNGDRFTIGHYIIAVTLDDESADASVPPQQSSASSGVAYQELWADPQDVAPPIERSQLRPPRDRAPPEKPDFLDWAADVPDADPFGDKSSSRRRPRPSAAATSADDSWAAGPMTPQPPPPPPPSEMPSPRRPVSTDDALPAAKSSGSAAPPTPRAEAIRSLGRPEFEASPVASPGDADQVLRRFAAAAGLPAEVFAGRNADEVADQLGVAMRLVVENMMQLLNARMQAKRVARSSNHTMIQQIDNSPFKFAPSAEEAMRVLFGPPTRNYLDARRALEQGFQDLKSHQIKTFSAMQHALTALMADLEPKAIEGGIEADRGIGGLMTSRKAKLWDAYLARWKGMEQAAGGSPIDVFMRLFAEAYDRGGSGGR